MTKPRWLLLLLILWLAFALRLYRLEIPSISGDEAWSWAVAGWSLPEIVSSDAETNPPLYHILLFVQMRLAGDSEFGLRLPSVWFGLLALAFMGRLGQAVGGWRLCTAVLALAAISPFLLYYAQDARMYGPALAGAAGSLTAFVLLWQRDDREAPRSLWLWYGAMSLTAVYSHYYAFSVLLAQAARVVWAYRRDWPRLRKWLAAWAAMAALFLPWLFIHLSFLDRKASSRFEEWTLAKLAEIARRTLTAYGGGVTLPAADQWLAWLAVGLAAIGAFGLWRMGKRRETAVLSAVILAGLLFAWGVNPIMPFFWERYLLVGMPAFALLSAAGAWQLARRWRWTAALSAAAVGFVSIVSLQNQFYDAAYLKGGYGRVIADIENQAQPGDVILLNNPLQGALYDYYGRDSLPAFVVDRGLLLDPAGMEAHLSAITGGASRVWVIETGNRASYDPEQKVRGWLSQRGSRAYFYNHPAGGELYLFVMTAAAGELTPAAAVLNDEIRLNGYRVTPTAARAGETLLLTLAWEGLVEMERPYTVFTHLIGPDGQLAAQTDGQPGGGARPTNSWGVGAAIEDHYAIRLPPDLPPGRYTIRIGMYTWPELTRLPINAPGQIVVDEALELTAVTVVSE